MELGKRQILQDWTRVEGFPVDEQECRNFEYHVVKDIAAERTTLTIKCFNEAAATVRLDPIVIPANSDPERYSDLAQRRVLALYVNGRI